MKTLFFILTFYLWTNFCFGQGTHIQGTIIDKKTNKPIKKAKVSFFVAADSLLMTAYSDRNGKYFVTTDVLGNFYLLIVKKKYFSQKIVNIRNEDNLDITLEKYFDIGLVH